MTSPLDPGGPGENKENEPDTGKSKPESGLSYKDLMPAGEHAAQAKSEHGKESAGTPQAEHFSKPLFSYDFGRKPQFLSLKSEFPHEKLEKSIPDLKPLVDNFLKETSGRKEHRLTEDQQRELEHIRESLAKSTSAEDALATVLQLAKLYQHLRYIEEAKKATDLSLGIDPDNQLGRELFKELEHMHSPDIAVSSQTASYSDSLSKANLRRRIHGLKGGRVIVLGDMLIDELLEGKPDRISREAPVLILEHVDTELIPGGAANTANNIAALGGACQAIGVCGRDEYASRLASLFENAGISHSLVQDHTRPTTVKTRILSKSHSFRQQLLRMDRISREPVGALVESMLIDRLRKSAGQYRAIILSDYRAGVITDAVIKACRAVSVEHDLKLIVDAQSQFERFQNVTLMTPNQPDTEQVVGFEINSPETLKQAGEDLLLRTGAKAVLITRGAQGMALFEQGQAMVQMPVFNRSEVFDVTGAGDTVVATMALAIVSGANFVEAMALGNLAAGIVVKKPGTATTNQDEMLSALEQISLPE